MPQDLTKLPEKAPGATPEKLVESNRLRAEARRRLERPSAKEKQEIAEGARELAEAMKKP